MRLRTSFVLLFTFLPLLIFSQEVTDSPREDTTNIKNFNVSVDFLNLLNHCIKRFESLAFKETDLLAPLWESYTYPVCRTIYIDYWQQRHKPHHG